jgi:hypothetical protein
MNKPWMGYLGSGLILVAGVMMLIDKSYLVGVLLLVMAIAGFILKLRMNSQK